VTARRWLPPTLWAAFTLVLTSIPGADLPPAPARGADKAVHLALYGTLGFLAVRAAAPPARPVTTAARILLAIALFAALDEIHQRFIPGRSMELFDWVADTLGAAAGGLLALVAARRGDRA
jgi:VanZ family protein